MTTDGAFLFSNRIGSHKARAPIVWRACASRRVLFSWHSWKLALFRVAGRRVVMFTANDP